MENASGLAEEAEEEGGAAAKSEPLVRGWHTGYPTLSLFSKDKGAEAEQEALVGATASR